MTTRGAAAALVVGALVMSGCGVVERVTPAPGYAWLERTAEGYVLSSRCEVWPLLDVRAQDASPTDRGSYDEKPAVWQITSKEGAPAVRLGADNAGYETVVAAPSDLSSRFLAIRYANGRWEGALWVRPADLAIGQVAWDDGAIISRAEFDAIPSDRFRRNGG